METNLCCKEGVYLSNNTINTLNVSCCCKCGCSGGDKPEPPTPEPPTKEYMTMTVMVDLSNSNPATCCSYADDAVGMTAGSAAWDEFFGHYPVMFKDGKEVGKLNPNDFTKFVDGTAADITSGAAGDVMIAFPRRGLKIETVGDIMTVSMTDDPDAEGFEYLAHVRGDERRDVFYLGAYEGSLLDASLRSLADKAPVNNQTIIVSRNQAQANGAGYEQNAFYQLIFKQAMYLLKYINLNSQAAVGAGYVNGTSPLNTGGTETKGMDWGESTGMQHMKLFGLEDCWGNLHEWTEGIVTDSSLNMLTGTDDFNDTGEGYSNQGSGVPANAHMQICVLTKPEGTIGRGFIPRETGNISPEMYFGDQCGLLKSSVGLSCGAFDGGTLMGIFCIIIAYATSAKYPNAGARLMYL